ncbi:MAG: hypothetical protein FWB80_11750 [Defluviitaleaceae bacterium]|nr:hypothetical protein [Defluviitaleaceae bacterium]
MSKLTEWNIAQKIQASGRRGMIVGIVIGVLVIIAIALVVVKICMLKRNYCCECDMEDDFDEDFYIDGDDEIDENGCVYTSEKDFA